MGTVLALALLFGLLSGRREGGGGGPVPGVPPALQGPPLLPPQAPADVMTHDGGTIVPPGGGPIPGVPAELQRAPVVTVTSEPAPPAPAPRPDRDGPGPQRQVRVSVQPDELPSSPELRALPVNVRAEGRRLALAAGSAVRAASGPRRPIEAVRAFQGYVGPTLAGVADGKWGRKTVRAARLFAGDGASLPGPVW